MHSNVLKWDLNGVCGNCCGILLLVLILPIPPAFLLVVALLQPPATLLEPVSFHFLEVLTLCPVAPCPFFLIVIFRQWLTFSFLPGGTVGGRSAHYCEKADLISGFIAVSFLFRVGFHRLWNYVLTFERECKDGRVKRGKKKKVFSLLLTF